MTRCRAILIALVVQMFAAAPPPNRGEMLYRGEIALAARLPGADEDLMPAAARCTNCHAPDGRGVKEGGINGENIRASALMRKSARRGGPPSSYSPATFCRALRTGADPAGVVLARAMPRYTISGGDCSALWSYLTSLH